MWNDCGAQPGQQVKISKTNPGINVNTDILMRTDDSSQRRGKSSPCCPLFPLGVIQDFTQDLQETGNGSGKPEIWKQIRPPGLPSATVRSYPKDSKICQYNSIIPANRKMSGEIMPERPWDLQYNHTRKTSLEHKKTGYLEHKKRAIAARADI